jgi:hypothetical protein
MVRDFAGLKRLGMEAGGFFEVVKVVVIYR